LSKVNGRMNAQDTWQPWRYDYYVLVPILVLAVPLLDTLLSPVRRYLRGRSAFAPDREHLHHRLVALGISEPRVVLLTYIVTGVCGAIAIWISRRG